MAEKLPKELGDGWVLYHAQEPQATKAAGTGTSTITVKEGQFVAHRRVGTDALYELSGGTMEELEQRIENWKTDQPAAAGSGRASDGNRELSADEKLEAARATAIGHITYGARYGGEVDLTETDTKKKAKAAIVTAHPQVKDEVVTGEQAESIVNPTVDATPPSATGKK